MTRQPLRIALSKGRVLEQALPLFAGIGIGLADAANRDRSLVLPTENPNIEFIVIRSADVPTYVEYGAAHLGVAGKDVLTEHGGNGLYEPLDLRIAQCRMVVAGKADKPLPPAGVRVRVATKYVRGTVDYFARRGNQVDLVKLYGSMELAPLVGLADYIVDLVDTGNTLRANGLVELEPMTTVSARLIVNKAAMKLRHSAVMAVVEQLDRQLAGKKRVRA